MDNFRRYRTRTTHASSIDGFVKHPSRREPGKLPKLKGGNAYNSEKSRIGNFHSTDGFHPVDRDIRHVGGELNNAPHTGRLSGQLTDEIIIDNHGGVDVPKTRRRVSLRRRPKGHDRPKKSILQRIQSIFIFNPLKRQNWTKQRAAAHAMVALVIIGGFFGGRAWWLANKIFQGGGGAVALQDNVDPSLLRGEGDGRVNVLLLGRGGAGHDGSDLTDTIVIASIDPIQKKAALLSIPRDLYVQSSFGSYSKINAVFANAKSSALANTSQSDKDRISKAESAGFKALENVIQSKIGIPIHYHAVIDFAGFAKAIDTVGGVDVDVPESASVYEGNMWIMGQQYTLNVQQGKSHFNGLRALAFSRSRHTSMRGDFDRSERQKLVMVALKDKVLSAGTYGNPIKINQLMGDFGNHIYTNLGLNEVQRLYEIIGQIPSNSISSVGLANPPNDYVTTGMVDGQSVVYPKAGLDNYKEIQHFVRNRLKDGFLANENASVAVYNGTSIVGLAGRTSDDLKSYGYNISTVADAPTKGVQKTLVIDLRHGEKKYTKRYLENRFGTTAAGSLPDNSKINPGSADFVIILGQNEQDRLAN